jgi:UDP-N-acetyl-2-amino-2-deoxyglucuronate dehydrogenase
MTTMTASAPSSHNSSRRTPPPLGVAIVGCGQIVTHHLAAMASLQADAAFVVRVVCDPSAARRLVIEQVCRSAGLLRVDTKKDASSTTTTTPVQLPHLASLAELLAAPALLATVDVIFIAVPHDLHASLATRALLESSKIVVLEKPLAPTREECEQLVTRSATCRREKQGSMLVMAEQSPYWQEVVRAKQMIAEGDIGMVVTAAAYYYESMRDNVTSGSVNATTGGLGWRGSLARAGGGIAMDGGLHWIRPLREMLGTRIAEVVGVTRQNLAPELAMEGECLGHALFKMAPPAHAPSRQPPGAGPLVATYSCNMLATAPMAHDACPYFRVTGNKGELIIHGDGLLRTPGAGGLRWYNEENPTGKEIFPLDRQGGFFLGFAGLWQEIHRICQQGDYDAAHQSVERASDDVRVVLALYKSAKSGRWEQT